MIEQREEPRQWPADHRPKAEWIDVTDLLRDGAAALYAVTVNIGRVPE